MATWTTQYPTTVDGSRVGNVPAEEIGSVIRLLDESSPLQKNLFQKPSSGLDRHTIAVQTDLPDEPATAKVERGFKWSVGRSRNDEFKMMRRRGGFRWDVAMEDSIQDPSANFGERYMDEVEVFAQACEEDLIYGSEATDPTKINGLEQYFNKLSNVNVIDGKGTGSDNRSIYAVLTGPQAVCMVHPKNGARGLVVRNPGAGMPGDMFMVTNADYEKADGTVESTGNLWVKGRTFEKSYGLVVPSIKYAARGCNIDISELNHDASGNSTDLTRMFASLRAKLTPVMRGTRMRLFYIASQAIAEATVQQAISKVKDSTLALGDIYGNQDMGRMIMVGNAPLYVCDSMDRDEPRVT